MSTVKQAACSEFKAPAPPRPAPPRIHLSPLQLDCNHISSAEPSAIITIKSQQLLQVPVAHSTLCTCCVNTPTSCASKPSLASLDVVMKSVLVQQLWPSIDPWIHSYSHGARIHSSIHPSMDSSIYTWSHGSIHLSIHPWIRPFIHQSIHISMDPSIYPSIYPSIHPWIHPSINPFIHGSMDLSIHSSMDPWICPSIHPWIHPSIHPFMEPWSHGPIHPSSGVFLYSPVCDLIAPMILFCFFLLLQFPALES